MSKGTGGRDGQRDRRRRDRGWKREVNEAEYKRGGRKLEAQSKPNKGRETNGVHKETKKG